MGFTIACHPGNQVFRDNIRARKPAFDAAKKSEKKMIARQILGGDSECGSPRTVLDGGSQPAKQRR
jgi:hypothetical protein